MPKALGVLMQVAGACYLLKSFALILAPAFASMLFPAIMLPPILAESSLAIWLVVKGVDLPKWEEKLRIAG